MSEDGDAMFIKDGWERVVENHSIINGDQLFFMYNGIDDVFYFFVVDPFGYEKIVVEGELARVVEVRREGSEDVFVLEVDIHNPVRRDIKKEDEDMDAARLEENHEDHHPLPQQDMDAIDEGNDDDDHTTLPEEDMDAATAEDNDDDDHTVFKEKRYNNNSSGPKRHASAKRGTIPKHFGEDLFRSRRYIQPNNALFVKKKIRRTRPSNLYIPKEVMKDYNIVLPPTVTLRDPRGREWITFVKIWGDGRTWLTGGWLNLCRWNLITREDRCICEFLPQTDNNNNQMVLQVTIAKEDAVNEE